jgi:hypothetical protein
MPTIDGPTHSRRIVAHYYFVVVAGAFLFLANQKKTLSAASERCSPVPVACPDHRQSRGWFASGSVIFLGQLPADHTNR